MKFPIYGKIKNVPNHQPENLHLLIRNPPKKTIDSPRFVDLPLGKWAKSPAKKQVKMLSPPEELPKSICEARNGYRPNLIPWGGCFVPKTTKIPWLSSWNFWKTPEKIGFPTSHGPSSHPSDFPHVPSSDPHLVRPTNWNCLRDQCCWSWPGRWKKTSRSGDDQVGIYNEFRTC